MKPSTSSSISLVFSPLWLLLLLVFHTGLIGQAYVPDIIPASPESQTFAKYGQYPVSHYTGVPYITIPLYTIKVSMLGFGRIG